MSGTILVGVNVSTLSRSAIAWSVARAAAIGARVELLHVVEDDTLAVGSAEARQLTTQGQTLVAGELTYALSVDPSVQVVATLTSGRPEQVLAERSEAYRLLVVGTHKTGFIYGRTFGSRFLGLGWRARCDVAFIPDRLGYDRKSVVAGVDDAPTSDAVVLFAAAEAARFSEELVLVSSWGAMAHAPRGVAGESRRVAALSRAVLLAQGSQRRLRVRTRLIERPAAESLVEASATATMLVIGRRQTPSEAATPRTVNHDVLINMSSPVIVVLDRHPAGAELDPLPTIRKTS
jgi:hypothetical protein